MKTQSSGPARDMIPRIEKGNSPSTTVPATGLVRDTIVLTRSGEVSVQDIRAGDYIISRDAGLIRVQDVVHHHVLMQAISIAAGSLGDTRPETDIVLPADQLILIRDWRAQALFGRDQALVPASTLVDGEFIRDQGHQALDLYSVKFEHQHVIYAGGLEVASARAAVIDLRPAT